MTTCVATWMSPSSASSTIAGKALLLCLSRIKEWVWCCRVPLATDGGCGAAMSACGQKRLHSDCRALRCVYETQLHQISATPGRCHSIVMAHPSRIDHAFLLLQSQQVGPTIVVWNMNFDSLHRSIQEIPCCHSCELSVPACGARVHASALFCLQCADERHDQ